MDGSTYRNLMRDMNAGNKKWEECVQRLSGNSAGDFPEHLKRETPVRLMSETLHQEDGWPYVSKSRERYECW
ncbi:hypothetical protein CEXT_385031 [Caerostris extrusa]|uniref:Uncharacterized protein n=1 Tax=Caerostris extrusa TaxID=172846 RepID=A0AAV4T795_CAEEX|nr:hypothetical protein CEXT_385031 [Caerostris extrusa]